MRVLAWLFAACGLLGLALPSAAYAETGGSSAAGYTWADSNDGSVTYSWIDVRAESAPLAPVSSCDDCVARDVPIGFSFPFFDRAYDAVNVGANGSLQFGDATTQWGPIALPSTTLNAPSILPFWSDWDPGGAGDIYVGQTTVDGRAALVVQWQGIENWDCSGGTATWEAILMADGRIRFQYLDAVLSDAYCSLGKDMTVGLQRDPLDPPGCHVQYSSDQAVIQNGMAIEWQPRTGPCSPAPVASTNTPVSPSDTPEPGETVAPSASETPAASDSTPSPGETGSGPPPAVPADEGSSNPTGAAAGAGASPVPTTSPGSVTATARSGATRTLEQQVLGGTTQDKKPRGPESAPEDSGSGVALPTAAALIAGAIALVAGGAAGFWWLRERRGVAA